MKNKCEWDPNFIRKQMLYLEGKKDDENLSYDDRERIAASIATYQYLLRLYNNELSFNNQGEMPNMQYAPSLIMQLFIDNMYDVEPFTAGDKYQHHLDYLSSLEEKPVTPLTINQKTETDIVNNVKTFWEHLSPTMTTEINKLEKLNPHCYQFDQKVNYAGHCFFDYYQRLPFLLIKKTNTLQDELALTHELTHALEFINCDYRGQALGCEVYPYLLAKLQHDYYQREGIETEDAKNLTHKLHNYALTDLKICSLQLKALKFVETNTEATFNDLATVFPEMDADELVKTLLIKSSHVFKNAISYAIALKLQEAYQDDEPTLINKLEQALTDKDYNFIEDHKKILVKN